MSATICVENVVKRYDKLTIIPGLSVKIKNGEFFTLLGPSGCGKTTLLRMIAGFNSIEGGIIKFDNMVINDIPAHKRNIGMVFQSYAVFPHLTVKQNVEYGLKLRKMPKREMKKTVEKILKLVRIEDYKDRLPEKLSGGQQQRVALARAIVIYPSVLLMDEPLSNLDAKLRIEMRSVIRNIQKEVGITTVYVTHDQEEALAISDRIAVMNDGVIQQLGEPQDIYTRPANVFVSTFIGHSNLLKGTVKINGNDKYIEFNNRYQMPVNNLVEDIRNNQKVIVAIRPDEFSAGNVGIEAKIISRTFLGMYINYEIAFGNDYMAEDNNLSNEWSQFLNHTQKLYDVNDRVRLTPDSNKINVFTADGDQSLIKDVKRYD